MSLTFRLLRYALYLALAGTLLGGLALGTAYWLLAPRLPSVETLRDVRLQVPLRVLAADGELIATFGETRRTPVRMDEVPEQLRNAFLAAEDADFYRHHGIDLSGIARAVWRTVSTGRKQVAGGSTITQQVARMFFLSPEVSYTRKLSEIFLAFRIEAALSKDEILELYLNKAFFGHRSYGIAAAAAFYYGKTLDELTLAECAMLASIPKFPSTGNPLSRPQRALERRAYVLGRMLDNRFIDRTDYELARAEPDQARAHEAPVEVDAPYFAELVRLEAVERLGNEALTDGYAITTTLDARRQRAANQALRDGLLAYDRRHGWRGAEAHVDLPEHAADQAWADVLAGYHPVGGLFPALVITSDAESALLRVSDGREVSLAADDVAWARPRAGSKGRGVDALLQRGDIVRLQPLEDGWRLAQLPQVEGALVALDAEDGAVVSLAGGFSFARSKFNRATQSARQPGSAFKPFLYAAAFDHGFTPASVLNDAPVQFPDPSRPGGMWMPKNDDDRFRGPIRLREALVRSVNLVSVRLLDAIGVRYARDYITRFGFGAGQIPENLSMALGTAAVSPLDMARGYAVFANGGYRVQPYLIREIADRDGMVVFQAEPALACAGCPARELTAGDAPTLAAANLGGDAPPAGTQLPGQPLLAPEAIDPRSAWLVSSLLRDVVRRGTGSAAMVLKRNDLAGKTGSTNDHRDAWFVGFSPHLVASAWVGFDDFSSLGRGEFGARAALPIWIDYMGAALADVPEAEFDMPPGITRVRVDAGSGFLAGAGDPDAILEFMKSEDAAQLATHTAREPDPDEQREAYDIF